MFSLFNTKRAWIAGLLMPVLLCSCATYNSRMTAYYSQLENKQYSKAMHTLDKTTFIQRDRNKLLYYFEKGKLYHLMQSYDSSSTYLNLADNLIETNKRTVGDIAKANLINPMMQTYLGEDMERFMMHYYKGLNYLYLNQTGEAVVEARRITIAENAQGDKFNNKTNRYSKDAFALNMQGMIYEANGDINNAFIAYRNAADVYLEAKNNYYGVQLPEQLKQDVLRTAQQMGFYEEQQRYSTLFNTNLKTDSTDGGYLVLFVERGLAPVKKERNFFIGSDANGLNSFYFMDETGSRINVPFDYSYYPSINRNQADLQSFRGLRVAIPYYEVRYTNNTPVQVTVNEQSYSSETAQDINTTATSILKERMLKEVADALARQVVKKLAEKAAEKVAEESSKSNSKEKDEKKKDDKAKNAGEITGFIVNLINTATEKADTRNWQSLPAYIQYVRIPLKKGENTLTIKGRTKTRTITVNGNGSLQFMSRAVW
jgi:hypothetical protein